MNVGHSNAFLNSVIVVKSEAGVSYSGITEVEHRHFIVA